VSRFQLLDEALYVRCDDLFHRLPLLRLFGVLGGLVMVGAFAEFERAMLKERTKAGLDAAREEGRVGGRRPKLTPQQQLESERWGFLHNAPKRVNSG
jgi:hypothetical protein